MEEVFFKNLSKKLTTEVLARLPIRSIMKCKCVCKSWRDLIEGREFATTYTSKPGLCFSSKDGCTVCDGEAFDPLFRFMIYPHEIGNPLCVNHHVIDSVNGHVIDSVNGLLLLLLVNKSAYVRSVCNPITREYVLLPPFPLRHKIRSDCMLGFGVSKLSGKCKVLCQGEYGLYVCDLGGGLRPSWRTISEAPPGRHIMFNKTTFLNGNLHWLTSDIENNYIVCCFDLETELFTRFSLPPRVYGNKILHAYRLCVLDGRLCLCDESIDCFVVIWTMNIYGDENSWIKEYMFHRPLHIDIHVWPLTVLANGDLLFVARYDGQLFINSNKNSKPLVAYDLLRRITYYSEVAIYTPSFYSLKANGVSNAHLINNHLTKVFNRIHNVQSIKFG